MNEPIWVLRSVINELHDEQIAEHGGTTGIRDENLLESAIARPQNSFHYGEKDIYMLAASYAFGIARNHAFLDGNKRTAFVTTSLFLSINGLTLNAEDENIKTIMPKIAAGEIDETEFAKWLQENTTNAQ